MDEGGARRHRDVAPWLAALTPATVPLPSDASDWELMDAVEVLHRTRAALDLERAQGARADLGSEAHQQHRR